MLGLAIFNGQNGSRGLDVTDGVRRERVGFGQGGPSGFGNRVRGLMHSENVFRELGAARSGSPSTPNNNFSQSSTNTYVHTQLSEIGVWWF